METTSLKDKESKKLLILRILSDRKSHPEEELAKITHRFSAVIHSLREEGYDIQTIPVAHNVFVYQLKVVSTAEQLKKLSSKLAENIPYLKMLVLFGSRATGKIHAKSDWDFAALYDETIRKSYVDTNPWLWFEVPSKLNELYHLPEDRVDVVDLNNCSRLVAHFVARDGKLIYEEEKGLFQQFKQQALMSSKELEALQNNLRHEVDNFLLEWGIL